MRDSAAILSEFTPTDLPELIRLLNAAEKDLRDFRPYAEDEFKLSILQDEVFDPKGLILAQQGSRLVGGAFAVVDPSYVDFQNQRRGFIRWIRVHPDYPADGLRNDLLHAASTFLATRDMEEVQVSIPSHNRVDMDFFKSVGFSLIRKFNYMERPLSGDLQDPSLPSGYAWTHFTHGEEREWVDCINATFKNHWGKRPTSLDEFTRWTRDPSFDPSGIIGIRRDGTLVGICYCEIDSSYAEYTGRKRSMLWVIGVIPSERRSGLGRAVSMAGMNWSRGRGMGLAALFVDSENLPAVNLYRGLHFETAYEVHHLLKKLSSRVG